MWPPRLKQVIAFVYPRTIKALPTIVYTFWINRLDDLLKSFRRFEKIIKMISARHQWCVAGFDVNLTDSNTVRHLYPPTLDFPAYYPLLYPGTI